MNEPRPVKHRTKVTQRGIGWAATFVASCTCGWQQDGAYTLNRRQWAHAEAAAHRKANVGKVVK